VRCATTPLDLYARASDYVDEVVSQIERLQEAGTAYATAGGIYFDLTAFPDYGRLSGRTNVLRGDPVSRLDAKSHKRNAGDFVLWKARKPGEPFWASQLGADGPDGTSRTRRSASACWARSTTAARCCGWSSTEQPYPIANAYLPRRHQGAQLDAQLVEIVHRLGGSTRDQLAAAEPLRDRASPVDLDVRVAARVVDGLDVYAGDLHHAASS
jgi:tRNA synthetases class I (C) catalytic domain